MVTRVTETFFSCSSFRVRMMINMMLEWLQRKCNKYTSREIQNNLLKIMAVSVLRSIAGQLQKSPFLTVSNDQQNS